MFHDSHEHRIMCNFCVKAKDCIRVTSGRMTSGGRYDTTSISSKLLDCTKFLGILRKQRREAVRAANAATSSQHKELRQAMLVAFVLRVQEDPSSTLHIQYLQRKFADRLSCADLQDAFEKIETKIDDTNLQQIMHIRNGSCETIDAKVFSLATAFRTEAAVHAWVVTQNVMQGIAPPSRSVSAVRRALLHSVKPTKTDLEMSLPLKAGEKKWVQRFQRRWGLSRGRLPAGDVVPVEELRSKV